MMTMTTGAASELRRRRSNALAALEAAAQRSAADPTDTTASVDVERHASALREYGEALTQLDLVDDEPYFGGKHSFFADLVNSRNLADAYERTRNAGVDYRSTTGAYGGLVVPRRLSDRIADSGHSRRPTCDLLAERLPDTGAPVIISRVSTGATAEVQSSELGAVTADSPATTETTLPVRSVVSLVDVSFQLTQRCDPQAFDLMVGREVVGAVDALEEAEVVSALVGLSGAGSYSLTSTSAGGLLDALARTSAASHEAAGTAPDLVVMAPRRWRWLLANAGNYGAAVTQSTEPGPIAGYVLGMRVAESASVPLTESTDQDRIVVARGDDLYLGEGPVRVELVTDANNQAPNLHSRVRAFRYYAFGAFKPAGVQVITGAGTANPY